MKTNGKDPQSSSSPFMFGNQGSSVPGQAESAPAPTAEPKKSRKAKKAPKNQQSDNSVFAPPAEAEDPGLAYGYQKSFFGRKNEVSAYAEQMDARFAMDRRTKILIVSLVILIVMLPVVAVLPIGIFNSNLSVAYLGEKLGENITGLANWITGGPVTSGVSIVFYQTVAAAFVGAALAVNGCIFQGALKNALAAPSTLGVTSGATLGTLIFSLFIAMPTQDATIILASDAQAQLASMDLPTYIISTQGRALCSLLGCFIVVGLVLLIAHIAGHGKVSKVSLLIAGQVFAALVAGVIAVIRTYIVYYGTEEQITTLQSVVGGNVLDIVDPISLFVLIIPLAIGMFIVLRLRFRMNLLAFNDAEAKSMGISTTFTRNLVIIICTAMTGFAVSFVGAVGFVGFLVPHMARKIIGPDFRYLVPASMIFGGIFLVLANYLMNLTSIFSGSLGTLTSLLGIVFFIIVVVRERARGNVDWL